MALAEEQNAVKAVDWMMKQCLKPTLVQNTGMWKQPAFDMLKYLADKFAVKKSSIYVITHCSI